jgi:hypothetical protein
MSKQPKTPTPDAFDENPEWTEADFARARRGAPCLWDAEAKAHIREAIAALEPRCSKDRPAVGRALTKMREALNELDHTN